MTDPAPSFLTVVQAADRRAAAARRIADRMVNAGADPDGPAVRRLAAAWRAAAHPAR